MAYKGSDLDPKFKSFFRSEKKKISKILTGKGCTRIEMDYGFYYFSGWFTDAKGQMWNFFCFDVRFTPYKMLTYRTVESYTDYTGGANQHVDIANLENWKV